MRKLNYDQVSSRRLQDREISDNHRLPLVVLLDGVRSCYNVGSIFRTSDGVLIRRLVLTGFTPRPPRPDIEKTALGATRSIPWEHVPDPLSALQEIRVQGYRIGCLEQTDGSIPLTRLTRDVFPLCLVVGNELTGVSSRVAAACDMAIEIPMYGIKHSLNVAVAYGVAVFTLSALWRAGAT